MVKPDEPAATAALEKATLISVEAGEVEVEIEEVETKTETGGPEGPATPPVK